MNGLDLFFFEAETLLFLILLNFNLVGLRSRAVGLIIGISISVTTI